MHCARTALKNFHKFCTFTPSHVLEQLSNRSLIRLSGEDTGALLQGLITNDIQNLNHGPGSMYAMFLNSRGRVLYDTIIYRAPKENLYYLEVDTDIVEQLKKHLNIYRLRRKVDISSIGDELKLWVYFDSNSTSDEKPWITREYKNSFTKKEIKDGELLIFKDPRLESLGSRIIATPDSDLQILEQFPEGSGPSYKQFRYRLGIGEGVEELPQGNCFPLEANCDFLHGVSFQKGCYIGQELTARTYYTGVIRKRLMPLILDKPFETEPAKDEIVKSGDANVGKLRGYEGKSALGLLRVEKVLEANKLIVNKIQASTVKPTWWPQEAVKERIQVTNTSNK